MAKMSLEERIKILEDEVQKLKVKKLDLYGLGVGDKFNLAGSQWTILDITNKGYLCIADILKEEMEFDSDSNDWKESSLRNWLNDDFYKDLVKEIGKENIIEFERDLLSLDGQDEYGSCTDKASLLTVDEYRKYRKLLPNTGEWCWLLTPWSTKCNGYGRTLTVVHPGGRVGICCCCYVSGVRPVCIFSSAIFESEDE